MSKKIKVSVIIPVYNVEKYLHECLNSVVNQTLYEIEIICINDGSTDNSLEILKRYKKIDSRIILIEQENKGLGATRNNGLDIAQGEYVYFLDSDDFIELNLLESVYNKSVKDNLDIVIFGSNSYNDKTKIFSDIVSGKLKGYSIENTTNKDVFSYRDMPTTIFSAFSNVVWNKLFKTSLLKENNIYSPSLHRAEDLYLVDLALVVANRIAVLDSVFVYYRIGVKSNSTTLDNHPLDVFAALKMLKATLVNIGKYEEVESSYILLLLLNSMYNLNNQKTYQGFQTVYNYIIENLDKDFELLKYEQLFLEQTEYVRTNFQNYKLMNQLTVDEYLEKIERFFINQKDITLMVTVIIPVFNVESYLRQCLDSVINQTLQNIEIICINDGSTDGSIDILREYSNKFENIIILNQINQGQSVSRNNGLNMAKGKYIYFLDSDDMIVPYALEMMFEEAIKTNLDVLYFDGTTIFETQELEYKFSDFKRSYSGKFNSSYLESGMELFKKMVISDSYYVSPCLSFIKADFIKGENIMFHKGIIHEDNLFSLQLILTAKRVRHIKQDLFIRRIRENSIMTTEINFLSFYGHFICYIEMLEFTKKIICTVDIEQVIVKLLNNRYNQVLLTFKSLSEFEKTKINKLTQMEQYYFLMFFGNNLPNNDKFIFTSSVDSVAIDKLKTELKFTKKEVNKYKGQIRYHVNDKALIKQSITYKIGRFITWLPRKILSLLK